jgi:hypothetical protein
VSYNIFDIELQNLALANKSLSDTGGACQVCVAGTYHKAVLYDPDNNFVALANPVTIKQGKMRFAMATGSTGQAVPQMADIFGITPAGHCFAHKGIAPGSPTEVFINSNMRQEFLVLPFSVADCTPGTEFNTGFVLPTNAIVESPVAVGITIASGVASKTISVGLLSSQSGGNATGFVSGMSLTSVAELITSLHGGSPTTGALLQETSGAGSTAIPNGALIGATAVNISYTLTSGATLAEGYIAIPLMLATGG